MESFVFLWLALILNVSPDCVLISVHSDCGQVVGICPELSLSDDVGDFWMVFEYCFGGDALD
jgi:hypothetical protein